LNVRDRCVDPRSFITSKAPIAGDLSPHRDESITKNLAKISFALGAIVWRRTSLEFSLGFNPAQPPFTPSLGMGHPTFHLPASQNPIAEVALIHVNDLSSAKSLLRSSERI
ncbi:MAG: hypothetical protein ACR2NZ_10710, partial [Rubripirellula sp.]